MCSGILKFLNDARDSIDAGRESQRGIVEGLKVGSNIETWGVLSLNSSRVHTRHGILSLTAKPRDTRRPEYGSIDDYISLYYITPQFITDNHNKDSVRSSFPLNYLHIHSWKNLTHGIVTTELEVEKSYSGSRLTFRVSQIFKVTSKIIIDSENSLNSLISSLKIKKTWWVNNIFNNGKVIRPTLSR